MLKSRQIKGGPHGVGKAVPRTVRRRHAKVGGTLPGVNGVNGSTHSAGCGGKGGTLSARRMAMLWPLPLAQRIGQRSCVWRGPPGRRISHNGGMSASTTSPSISAVVESGRTSSEASTMLACRMLPSLSGYVGGQFTANLAPPHLLYQWHQQPRRGREHRCGFQRCSRLGSRSAEPGIAARQSGCSHPDCRATGYCEAEQLKHCGLSLQ
jgi:hypothetical protein